MMRAVFIRVNLTFLPAWSGQMPINDLKQRATPHKEQVQNKEQLQNKEQVPNKEQVRKGGLPPLRTDIGLRAPTGVNRPPLPVLFEVVVATQAYFMLLRPFASAASLWSISSPT